MTDQRWVNSLRSSSLKALRDCVFEDRWPQYESYTNQVFRLSQEALKHKKDWLTISNVYGIFLQRVVQLLNGALARNEQVRGRITESFTDQALHEVADGIAQFIVSIPRTYLHYVPLPGITTAHFKDLKLSEDISLTSFSEDDEVPGGTHQGGLLLDFRPRLQFDQVYIILRERGFARNSIEDSAPARALSKLKQLIHSAALTRTLRVRDASSGAGLGLGSSFSGHHVPDLSMIVYEETTPLDALCSLLLPINVSVHVNRIELDDENEAYVAASEKGTEHIAGYIKGRLALLIPIFDSDKEGAESVRAALDHAAFKWSRMDCQDINNGRGS